MQEMTTIDKAFSLLAAESVDSMRRLEQLRLTDQPVSTLPRNVIERMQYQFSTLAEYLNYLLTDQPVDIADHAG